MVFSMTSKKTVSPGTLLRWFIYAVLVAIPIVLFIASHELKKTEPQREAAAKAAQLAARAEYDKKHPWCTQEATYAIKDSAGTLVNTQQHVEKVRCSPDMEAVKAQEERMAKDDRVIKVLSIVGPFVGFLLTLLLSKR